MKTKANRIKVKTLGTFTVMLLIFSCLNLLAQESMRQSKFSEDPLFPVKGRSQLSIGTGIPYVGAIEYVYGFTKRFSVGAVVGITPDGPAYGLRFRGVLFQGKQNFRTYFKFPLLYYPGSDRNPNPWVLAWPKINSEWKTETGMRISLGGGIMMTRCVNSIIPGIAPEKKRMSEEDMLCSVSCPEEEQEQMGGSWNTIQAGIAIPVSKRMQFHAEASLVMKGLKPAEDWQWKPPIIIITGLTISLGKIR